MLREGKIGLFEAVTLTTLFISTKIFYTSLSVLISLVGTAAWYTTLLSCCVSIGFFMLIYLLMKRFEGNNLIEILEKVTGKVVGKIISVVFCAYGIYYAGSSLREFLEMIKAYNLPNTPISFIIILFMLVVIFLVFTGLEGIGKVSAICFIPIAIGFLGIILLVSPNYDFDYLKPYFGHGIYKSLKFGLLRSSAYDEVIILTFIIKSLNGTKTFLKSGIISLVISGCALSIAFIAYLSVFQYTMGMENMSGFFQLSRIIYFSRYIQRLESIFLFIWVISSVITVAISTYITISIYCKTFLISNFKPLIIPFVLLICLVSLLPNSFSELIDINMMIIKDYSMLFVYIVPVLILVISFIFPRRGWKNAKKV